MSIGKREKLLIIVLGILVYLLLFYYVAWVPTIPQIKGKSQELIKLTQQKAYLDEEVKNIQTKKFYLNSLNTASERLDSFLISNGDFSDSIDYLTKLANLIGKEILEINVSSPQKLKGEANPSVSNYYSLDVAIKGILTYDEVVKMSEYIESTTTKAAITNFTISGVADKTKLAGLPQIKPQLPVAAVPTPKTGKKTVKQTPPPALQQAAVINPNGYYQVSMTISLFAAKSEPIDKLYQYSKNKFNKYDETGVIPFNPEVKK